mgnify:CR=1 FL=1|jgi:Leucine-rich repeat (LRR) protein
MTGLQKLDLSQVPRFSLPAFLALHFPQPMTVLMKLLPTLQKPSLAQNRVTAIPRGIGLNFTLRELALACNRIEKAPRSLMGLTNLQRLDLSNNRLSASAGPGARRPGSGAGTLSAARQMQSATAPLVQRVR